MALSRVDVIAHPIRARIILALTNQTLTIQQIAGLLPDVPRASLYRHVRELADGDIIIVVRERRVRGTIEATYAIRPRSTILTPDEIASASNEENLRLVTSFLGGVAHAYQAYLAEPEGGTPQEMFTRVLSLNLTTEEFQRVKRQLLEILLPLEANEPTPERRRRLICLLGVPEQPVVSASDEE
jgi:hypothetical protein